jgi:post-segregation antitoxin (ccd killing protein)
MMAQLDKVTIEDLCHQARTKGLNVSPTAQHAGHAAI